MSDQREFTADELDGICTIGPHRLKFTIGGMKALKETLGLDSILQVPDILNELDPERVMICLWAGRLWEAPDKKVEDYFDAGVPLVEVMARLHIAFNLALFGPKGPPVREEAKGAVDPTSGMTKITSESADEPESTSGDTWPSPSTN